MNAVTHGHHKGNSTENLINKADILEALGILPGRTVLDAGCGNGYMSKEFSHLVGSLGKVYALDPSPEAIDSLRKETEGSNIVPMKGDITGNTGIPGSSIDLIYLSTVFHIFSEKQRNGFLKEIKRLLKSKGKLAVVEIDKKETPFGPPLSMRISPDELTEMTGLTPLSLFRAGEYFYLHISENV